MNNISKRLMFFVSIPAFLIPGFASATNGMNLEGYGPEATAMGGASMAYDNGTAAMMNNPATLGMMQDGKRADLALGMLGPHITSSMPGQADADSSATAFFMPAIGWASKSNMLTYGFGIFAQGGMGTEYEGSSFMSAGSGLTTRSEVGVGRAMIPIAYNVTNQLTIGGSLDFVWAGMDLQMAMSGSQMMDMMPTTINPNATQAGGTLSGTLVDGLGGMLASAGGPITALNWGYFDFSNDNAFLGEAFATGVSGKLGAAFKVNPKLSFGATYHAKTFLGDLTTSNAEVTMNVTGDELGLTGQGTAGNSATVPMAMPGEITIVDFQWPSMYAMGVAFQATDDLMLAADVKRINWSGVMDSFKMKFKVDSSVPNFGGAVMDAELYQEWEDQTVFAVGASYKVTKKIIVRAGLNRGDNPIPDKFLNALFPAVEHNHATFGGGYMINKSSVVNLSMTYAPEFKPTSGSGVSTGMSQFNWQLMYSLFY